MTAPTVPGSRAKRYGLRILFVLFVLSCVSLLIMCWATLQKSGQSASDTAAIRTGNDLRTCRAVFHIPLDDAFAEEVEAQAQMAALNSTRDEAVARGDQEALSTAIASGPETRKRVTEAAAAMKNATDFFTAAVQEAKDDPDRFLDRCNP